MYIMVTERLAWRKITHFYKVTNEGLCHTKPTSSEPLKQLWDWESISEYFLRNKTARFMTKLIWTVLTDDEYFLESI